MMKNRLLKSKLLITGTLVSIMLFTASCMNNLLDRDPTGEPYTEYFWETEDDALYALNGVYSAVRPVFDRDYYLDGHGEYVRMRNGNGSASNGNLSSGGAYYGSKYNPSGYGDGFDNMYEALYGGVNRTNYVIENIEKIMIPKAKTDKERIFLETIVAEARLLRGMVYFKLISMWGDVPFYTNIIYNNSEVQNISRTPMADIKDHIMTDFNYAVDKLPDNSKVVGRASKPAALAFRGKLQLYWACWNNFGWPELDGFKPSKAEATTAYTAAADDFRKVINDFNLALYQNGEPGDIDDLGAAEKLPNYYHLFTPKTNGDPEMIMVFTHGGRGTGQGEELLRDFAGRSHESAQCWVHPRYEIADRYQSTITGDFATPLIPMDPKKPDARTAPNSALNPKSYENRDYRMKASIMWDYETCIGLKSLKSTGWLPFIYKTWGGTVTINGEQLTTYSTDGCNSGYVFRKFVRNYGGQGRSEGDFNWPVMRLADVYLMYAEATNEVSGPQADAIGLVNKVRHRGNLPALASAKTGDKDSFFEAIEQERIIELIGEGHRGFDLRRWRAFERVWGPPYSGGLWRRDTHGANVTRYFQNQSELTYERCYIFRIPPSERNRNPNLTQNRPWL